MYYAITLEIGSNLNAFLNALTVAILAFLTRRAIRAEKNALAAKVTAERARVTVAQVQQTASEVQETVEHVERIVNGEDPPAVDRKR